MRQRFVLFFLALASLALGHSVFGCGSETPTTDTNTNNSNNADDNDNSNNTDAINGGSSSDRGNRGSGDDRGRGSEHGHSYSGGDRESGKDINEGWWLNWDPHKTTPRVIPHCSSIDAGSASAAQSDGGSLDRKVVDCSGTSTKKTTLRGKVYDPAGANGIYNATVYIPGGPSPEVLPPIADSTQEPAGIVCKSLTCARAPSDALRYTATNVLGEFELDDVPVDVAVPIVVQIGKWRRLVHVDVTHACAVNEAPDCAIRLPRNHHEGDLPQLAVTTGAFDELECFLYGIGIDEKEFVNGHAGPGHIHLFKGSGGALGPPAETFWNHASQLRKYDQVLLSCEGSEELANKTNRGAMLEYLNAGGKVFATHYQYAWFRYSPSPALQNLAVWGDNTNFKFYFAYDINQAFANGKAFAEWLSATGGSLTPGKISLSNLTHSINAVHAPAVPWIMGPNGDQVKYFTVNTPIGAPPEQQCGRAIFTDVHITNAGSPKSISSCTPAPGELNADQKALEFLFFMDLFGCDRPAGFEVPVRKNPFPPGSPIP